MWRAGSEESFEALAKRGKALVYSATWRQVSNWEQPHDIMQPDFVILAHKIENAISLFH